jgi:cell division protein FtsI/penicillin-binding protein 2
MLVNVIENGHAKRAGVNGYYVAGKTGTAQVAARGKKGYSDRTIHTFVGFAPVEEPKFVMLVKLDDPKSVKFAASSAAPLFGEIAEFLLNYMEVPKER